MKITEEMLYELLMELNKKLKNDYMNDMMEKHFICNMMQIKRISVYDHSEKIQITITAEQKSHNSISESR